MPIFRRRGVRPEQGSRTVTWRLRRASDEAPDNPVFGLRWLPDGPTFLFDDYVFEGRPRKWLTVGSDEDRDIVVRPRKEEDRGTISALHCLLCRDRKTQRVYVLDADSKNGTYVNDTMAVDGTLELASGSLLRLGPETLLACGQAEQRPNISGENLHQFLSNALATHGSHRAAAAALNVNAETFRRWLKTAKFGE